MMKRELRLGRWNGMNQELLRSFGEFSDNERHYRRMLESGNRPLVRPVPYPFEPGKLISVGAGSRFDHYLEHTHNFVEMIYVCSGAITHSVNGVEIPQYAGELLFLNQNAKHERLPAWEDDIFINFKILPQFFNVPMGMMGGKGRVLHKFLLNCQQYDNQSGDYLHFKAADNLQVQNLMENLLLASLVKKEQNLQGIEQFTMGLLFLHLLNDMDQRHLDSEQSGLVSKIMEYVEQNYAEGSLAGLAKLLSYDMNWLSRNIKRLVGSNFEDLRRNKRIEQAKLFLATTDQPVTEIARLVGCDSSHFYRLFLSQVGCSPGDYRKNSKTKRAAI